ncbi:MAG TPA: signal peptidase II [Thermomicrobiales bacterium]|jgi:signal peptidase II|nr:signal peptidase II [Thermomicrobiales bacterium]
MNGSRWLVPAVVAVLVIALDQLVKFIILGTLGSGNGRSAWLLGDWLGLSYVENRGAAFGAFVGYGAILSVIAIGVVSGAGLIYARVLAPTIWLATGLGMVIGGALGNITDRVRLGFVVDFVAVGTFPRFNVADSAITIGVLLLAWRLGWADEGARDEPVPVRDDAQAITPDAPSMRPDGKDR